MGFEGSSSETKYFLDSQTSQITSITCPRNLDKTWYNYFVRNQNPVQKQGKARLGAILALLAVVYQMHPVLIMRPGVLVS
jgi:hypothetical protein